jgi:hypothetical protein
VDAVAVAPRSQSSPDSRTKLPQLARDDSGFSGVCAESIPASAPCSFDAAPSATPHPIAAHDATNAATTAPRTPRALGANREREIFFRARWFKGHSSALLQMEFGVPPDHVA